MHYVNKDGTRISDMLFSTSIGYAITIEQLELILSREELTRLLTRRYIII